MTHTSNIEFIRQGRGKWKFCIILLFIVLFFVHPPLGITTELKRIVVMVTMPVPACEAHLKYFLAQLGDLGYEDGNNMELTVIRAQGDRQFAEDELRNVLKTSTPDAVATIATLASQAALNVLKETSIPIVFFQVSDPVGAGLIKKMGEPTGTHLTGRIFTVSEEASIDLTMRLIGQTYPEKTPLRVGYIHSTYPSAMGDLQKLKAIEKERSDIQFVPYQIPYEQVPDGIPTMLAGVNKGIKALVDKVDFWWEPQGPLGELQSYTKLLLSHSNIPMAKGQTLESVRRGALFHITPDIEASAREAADLLDTILKGANPGEMPVIPSAEFQIGINLTTALKLNIVVPPDILHLAGKHIYK